LAPPEGIGLPPSSFSPWRQTPASPLRAIASVRDEQWTRIYEFNMAKGAAYYASKYVTKQFGEWELSDNIEAFRIQQPTLPLAGQKGFPRTEKFTRSEDKSRLSRTPLNGGIGQLVLVDFTEPDMSEVDTDEVRASFCLEIKVKKRR
jgi:hypothetical protein